MRYFTYFVTVRQYITNMVIIVYAQPLTFVWISCLLFGACRMGASTLSSIMGSLPSGLVIELEN